MKKKKLFQWQEWVKKERKLRKKVRFKKKFSIGSLKTF